MDSLLNKISKIEALILGASTNGEKNAALSAKERILNKHPHLEIHREPKEYSLQTSGEWNKKLLIAICRKYGVKPYRYKRQKYTTVMVNINEDFLNEILWKEYTEYSNHLNRLIEEITESLISKIHKYEEEDIIHGNLTQ
ncbi:MAG: hypothetical protein RIA69_05955 [Cyclobacteriaceae bacterium]